jgi:NAD+ synthase (glutamine-hydrolysing)
LQGLQGFKILNPASGIANGHWLWYISAMKVRAIQFSPTLGNIEENLEFHVVKINQAIRDGCELIVFPELSLSGYHLKDIACDIALKKDGPAWRELEKLSKKIDIIVGAPLEEEPGIIYNTALYFSRGKWRHTHRKVQLPNYGMFEERMIFKPGDEFRKFKIGTMTAGILICREILFPMLAYLYFIQKTDLLIGISNSPQRGIGMDGISSFQLWETMGYVFSQFYHQNYLFVNRVASKTASVSAAVLFSPAPARASAGKPGTSMKTCSTRRSNRPTCAAPA